MDVDKPSTYQMSWYEFKSRDPPHKTREYSQGFRHKILMKIK